MKRKILLICGAVSSVLYVVGDVLGTLRYPGYSYADQTFSELTAPGSPTRSLMMLSGSPYTALVAAFAGGVWASAEPKRAGRVTGASHAARIRGRRHGDGGVLPDEATRGPGGGRGNVAQRHAPPGTIVMSLFTVLAMGFGATLLGKRFRYYSYGTIATLIVFGVLASLQAGRMAANQPTPWMGIEERINIYATMLWVAVLAIGLLRTQEEAR